MAIKGRPMVKIGAITNAMLMKLLLDGIYTNLEMAEMSGLSLQVVNRYTREMHRIEAAHIADWAPDTIGRMTVRIFMLGPGKDMPQPLKPTSVSNREQRGRRAMLELIQRSAGVVPIAA